MCRCAQLINQVFIAGPQDTAYWFTDLMTTSVSTPRRLAAVAKWHTSQSRQAAGHHIFCVYGFTGS